MIKKSIIFLMSACFLIISCASTPKATPKPEWVDNPKAVFDDELYISRVGEGFEKTEALSNAQLELARYFGQNIKSTVQGTNTWTSSSSKGTENEKTLSKDYTITLDTNLFAVNRTKPWFDVNSDTWYICAYINREEAFEIYKPTVIEAKNDFDIFYKESIAEDDFFKKISLLKDTKIIGDKYSEVLSFAQILLPSISRVYKQDFDNIASVGIMLKKLQNDAAVKISVKNDYGSKIKDFVSKIVGKNGFNISDSNYQYIVSVEINTNKHEDEMSGIISLTPSVTIMLKDRKTDDVPFTYTKNFERFKSYREDLVEKKAFEAIEEELNNSFENELQAFLKNR